MSLKSLENRLRQFIALRVRCDDCCVALLHSLQVRMLMFSTSSQTFEMASTVTKLHIITKCPLGVCKLEELW